MHIELLSASDAKARKPELSALLHDAVQHGASVGFVTPLPNEDVESYWNNVIAEIDAGRKILAAAIDTGQLIGAAQLAMESRANGRHRAEVQKVLVLASARRRGIGAALMSRLEKEAAARGRWLLFLDTSTGRGGAEDFYAALGYTFVGSIPAYAADPDGRLAPNAIFYKHLEGASSAPAVVR